MSAAPLVRLFRLFGPDRRLIALATGLQFGTIAAGVALMATSAWLIARAAEKPSIAALSLAVVGVRAFGIGRGVLRYLERLVSHDVTLRMVARLRGWLYDTLEPLAPARLVERRSGELSSRLVADVDALEHVQVRLVGPTLAGLLVVVLVAILLASRSAWLAVIATSGLLLGGVGASWLAWRGGRTAAARAVVLRGELEALVVDGAQGLAELIAFGRVPAHAAALDRAGRDLAAAQVRAAGMASLGGSLTGLAADLTALGVLSAAIVATGGGLPPVQLAVVTLLTLAAFEAVAPLPAAWQALEAAKAAARRMVELADTPPAVSATVDPLPGPTGRRLEARGVSFAYPKSANSALRDVSFLLEPGRLVAIVGPSGSGKSTVLSLVLRFWEAPAGSLLMDGLDLGRFDPDAVRACVSALPQRAHLFTGTIAENLRIGRPTATDDDLAAALNAAGLGAFVAALPDGLQSWVGEQGINLSGGERQRLALARALLREAPFLVLDEPTAHVDAATERRILTSLAAEASRRGVLLVTHRLAGLDVADEILVLVRGAVVERGRWGDLAAAGGPFSRMLRLQSASIDERLRARPGDGSPD